MTTTTTTSLQQFSPAPAGPRPITAVHDEQCGAAHADRLWTELTRARAGDRLLVQVNTEDAVFRFYLPLARASARVSPHFQRDPEGADRAAELGLARAVLAWRHPSGQGFDRAARGAISSQLRRIQALPAATRRSASRFTARTAPTPTDE
jgi:hypothetical protein